MALQPQQPAVLAGPRPNGTLGNASRRLVGNASKRRRKMIAFGWYGGKFVHLSFIFPHLPTDAEHFCDVYGGSAAVLARSAGASGEWRVVGAAADDRYGEKSLIVFF